MKKSPASSMAKNRGIQTESTEMKAALQLFQFSTGEGNGDDYSDNQDNDAGSGSILPIRDEDNRRLKHGIPKSKKFRSISDLYKCTERLSPVEDEYNWSFPTGKDPNTNITTKEDSSIKTNKKNAKMLNHYPEVNSDGEIVDKMGCVNKRRKLRSIVDIYEATKPVDRDMNNN